MFACLIMASTVSAQTKLGKFNFSAGIGLEPTHFTDKSTMNTPPIGLKAGYQFSQLFSLNAFAGFSSTTSQAQVINDGLVTQATNKHLLLGLRGEMRKELSNRFDIYGGGLLGYSMTDVQEINPVTGNAVSRPVGEPTPYDPNAPKGKFMYSGFIGSTFYLKNQIGLFAEVGYGVSLLQTGITVRL